MSIELDNGMSTGVESRELSSSLDELEGHGCVRFDVSRVVRDRRAARGQSYHAYFVLSGENVDANRNCNINV